MIDLKMTEHILNLSHLTVTTEEKTMLLTQVGRILDYFESLSQYFTNQALSEDQVPFITPEDLRQDEVQPSLNSHMVKLFATSFVDQYFAIPQIIDKNEESL